MQSRIKLTRHGWYLALLVAAMAGAGCQGELKTKNEALMQENLALRDRLQTTEEALFAAEAERDALLAAGTAPTPGEPGANAFEGIPGIATMTSARGEVTVRVPGDVLFSSGSVVLKTKAKSTLDQIAGVLNNQYASNSIRVEGYTDTDPIKKSKWKDNEELSAQRALAVERHLGSRGVSKDRIYSAGFGASNQLSTKSKSRRVEIVVLVQ